MLYELQIIEKRIICLDAVSLYPSPMKRLYCLEGILEILQSNQSKQDYLLRHLFEYNQISPHMDRFISGFFIEYQIMWYKEPKFRLLPNLSKNEIVFLDHLLLEDLVKFYKMNGQVIPVYYYNCNRNLRIRDVIEEICQLQVANKKTLVEEIIKIALNRRSEKTILKPILSEVTFITNLKLDDYLVRHFKNIIVSETIKVEKFTKKKEKKLIETQKHLTSLGFNILSMSSNSY
jgi:hypothetical protein